MRETAYASGCGRASDRNTAWLNLEPGGHSPGPARSYRGRRRAVRVLRRQGEIAMNALAPLLAATMAVLTFRAEAATFVETGDAGDALATANLVNTGGVQAIAGTVETLGDADLFAVWLTAGVPFTASSATSP